MVKIVPRKIQGDLPGEVLLAVTEDQLVGGQDLPGLPSEPDVERSLIYVVADLGQDVIPPGDGKCLMKQIASFER